MAAVQDADAKSGGHCGNNPRAGVAFQTDPEVPPSLSQEVLGHWSVHTSWPVGDEGYRFAIIKIQIGGQAPGQGVTSQDYVVLVEFISYDLNKGEVELTVPEAGSYHAAEANFGVDADLGVLVSKVLQDGRHLAQNWFIVAAKTDRSRQFGQFEAGDSGVVGVQDTFGVNQEILADDGKCYSLATADQ